jgi:hypothetical protein
MGISVGQTRLMSFLNLRMFLLCFHVIVREWRPQCSTYPTLWPAHQKKLRPAFPYDHLPGINPARKRKQLAKRA